MASAEGLRATVNQLLEGNRALPFRRHRQHSRQVWQRWDLAQALRKDELRKLLVDTKGIGKAEHFYNEEQGFRRWVRTVNNLVTSIFGKEFETVLLRCLDQDEEIIEALEAKQLFRLLSSLTHEKSEDIVIGSRA